MQLAKVYFVCNFFFNDTATTEIYTLSLHDALPISPANTIPQCQPQCSHMMARRPARSEEHTSELKSRRDLVCRLLLENTTKQSDLPDLAYTTLRNNNITPTTVYD